MFFDEVKEIQEIARKNGTSVFVVPKNIAVELPKAILLEPTEKTVISIEQIRAMQEKVEKKQIEELFVIIRPAEKMAATTANALLKTLEEPRERVHFVLITEQPSSLLATILSRAAIYFLRTRRDFSAPVEGSEKLKTLARQLVISNGAELVELAKKVTTARSGGVKEQTLEVLELAIEICLKSYFKTKKGVFLEKMEKLIEINRRIERGGNIKLQIVALLG